MLLVMISLISCSKSTYYYSAKEIYIGQYNPHRCDMYARSSCMIVKNSSWMEYHYPDNLMVVGPYEQTKDTIIFIPKYVTELSGRQYLYEQRGIKTEKIHEPLCMASLENDSSIISLPKFFKIVDTNHLVELDAFDFSFEEPFFRPKDKPDDSIMFVRIDLFKKE